MFIGIAIGIAPSIKEVGELILGLPTTIFLVATCIWIVKKVRSNSMARVLAALENGTFKEPEKKIEL